MTMKNVFSKFFAIAGVFGIMLSGFTPFGFADSDDEWRARSKKCQGIRQVRENIQQLYVRSETSHTSCEQDSDCVFTPTYDFCGRRLVNHQAKAAFELFMDSAALAEIQTAFTENRCSDFEPVGRCARVRGVRCQENACVATWGP